MIEVAVMLQWLDLHDLDGLRALASVLYGR